MQRSDGSLPRSLMGWGGRCKGGMGAYSDEVVHRFRAKSSTCSGRSRPPVPGQAVHRFRGKPSGLERGS